MTTGRMRKLAVMVGMAAGLGVLPVAAQTVQSVRLPRAVMANGQSLPAGTYTLRLSSETVSPVVGQSSEAARWVEFVQGGSVKGRELATVIPPADVKEVAKRTPPPAGSARVELLKGADYLRVWANLGGTQYLVHLTAAPAK